MMKGAFVMPGMKKSVYLNDRSLRMLDDMTDKETSASFVINQAIVNQALFARIGVSITPEALVAIVTENMHLLQITEPCDGAIVVGVKKEGYKTKDGAPGPLKKVTDVIRSYYIGSSECEGFSFRDAIGRIDGTTDRFGNNIDFADSVVGSMTMKGLLGKWLGVVVDDCRSCLIRYYSDEYAKFCEDIEPPEVYVRRWFDETAAKFKCLTPVLDDLVNSRLYGIGDILIAAYGVDSDEVYAYREFERLSEKKKFSTATMWDNAAHDPLLRKILFGNKFPDCREPEIDVIGVPAREQYGFGRSELESDSADTQ